GQREVADHIVGERRLGLSRQGRSPESEKAAGCGCGGRAASPNGEGRQMQIQRYLYMLSADGESSPPTPAMRPARGRTCRPLPLPAAQGGTGAVGGLKLTDVYGCHPSLSPLPDAGSAGGDGRAKAGRPRFRDVPADERAER